MKGLLKTFFQDSNLHDFHFLLAWLVSGTVSRHAQQNPSQNGNKFDKMVMECAN